MSDTRAEAEKEIDTVEMSSNLEDSLGSALESSFNIPPPPPAPLKGSEKSHEPNAIPDETVKASQSETIEGMAEWKDTLENYTKEWQAESSIAREKALATRIRIEKENSDAEKKMKDDLAKEKKFKLDAEKKKRDEERLKAELESDDISSLKNKKQLKSNEKVKEAWELVGEKKDSKGTVETDGRGPSKEAKKDIKTLSYDPTKSTDPIPPVFQDPVPASQTSAPTESATLSRHSATSGAWEEVSRGSPGSGSSGEQVSRPQSNSEESDIVNIPSSSKGNDDKNQSQPPQQPPSLTLSLFDPSQLTFRRVLAVVGINLILPFVNGVFLGFGEIFAREVVRVGKLVWRGERTIWSFGRGAAAGRGTSGVGLSGGF
ncbi:uncharacterized protein I206_105884 [Kwoniella pini CBS 10737]|uniref:Uncharacterized protein n=1 Tax=Kwoniella pini CBS 10737 TaxID=1296096 RepID=A0A1B9I0G2_9TREE|nr:uncharacterized protein I206_04704 [Kwoniella pini CBS 10737]OCF49017.1 hypothetical protein I206_04704 [Kwoniella pini CBS 10737]